MANPIRRMHFLFILVLTLFANFNDGQRIGSSLRPLHYDLVLLPIISGSSPRLCGHVFIDLEPTTSTNVVTFHGVDITLLDVSVEPVLGVRNGTTTNFSDDRFLQLEDLCFSGLFVSVSRVFQRIQDDPERQQFSIILKQSLKKGKRYRIGLLYMANVRDESKGFYRINYKTNDDSCCHEGWFGGTQMQVTEARKVLPCLDEPGFKSTFDIIVGHNKAMSALANMPEMATVPMVNTRDWMWTSFSRTPLMPTYLLAMFVTDYQHLEQVYQVGDRTVKLRYWGRPEQLPHFKHIMEVTPKMLHYMETYVNQPFSLPKLDFITAPIDLHFEAMENWGLILFRDDKLYHNEETDSEDDRFYRTQIMAHELAHQFFGNLVTCDWWSDIWFNEGFSSFLEVDIINHAMPNETFRPEAAQLKGIRNAMKFEEKHVKPLTVVRQVETADEADRMFDAISYSKGNGLLLMLRNFVGQETFQIAVATYMERFQFQSVNSQRFMEILDEELHQDREFGRTMNVTKIMNSWTGQPSYPIVRCSKTGDGRIRLSQEPFPMSYNYSSHGKDTRLWWIPLAMTDAKRPDFSHGGTYPRIWLTPDRSTLEIPYFPPLSRHQAAEDAENSWIFINGQSSSYIRVLYDKSNWRLLSKQLMINHTVIPKVSRAQLIDDAFTLAVAGLLEYETVLDLIEYLTLVNDEFVRSTSQFHLQWMKERSRHNESLYQLFGEYTRRFKYEKMDKGESDEYHNLIRLDAFDPLDGIDCHNWSDGVCVDQVLRLFRAQMTGTITPGEKRAMFENLERNWCVVIRHAGKEEWEWAWRATLRDLSSTQRIKILSAMTCTPHRGQLKQLLARVFSPTIDQNPHETFKTIEKMAENPVARSMVLNFIKNNWESLERHFKRSGETLKLLASAAKHLSNAEDLDEMSQLIFELQNKDNKLDHSVTEGILDGIRSNIRWAEKNLDEVYSVLAARVITRRTDKSFTSPYVNTI